MASTRRTLLIGAGAVMAGAAGLGAARYFGIAEPDASLLASPAEAQTVDTEELMVAGPLGEKSLGEADAPVTVIEYASLTCSHCANFHSNSYPQLKSEYIDAGKVLFIFREFPLDPVATAGFMLARCLEDDRYFPFVEAMFAQQERWAFADNIEEGLFQMARQAGFTREKFEECLTNQKILDGVNWVKERASEDFGVDSTPTFFVNGEKISGALPFDQFQEIVEKHLSS